MEGPVCFSAACHWIKKSAIRDTYPIDDDEDPNEKREIEVGPRYASILGIVNNAVRTEAPYKLKRS